MKKTTARKTAKKKASTKRTAKKASPPRGVKNMRSTTIKGKKTERSIIRSINPYTEEVMNEFMTMSPAEVRSIIARSRETFASWRDRPVAERLSHVKLLGEVLRAEKRSY